MGSSGALIVAAAAVMLLIASALWAERRFAGYAKLPAHFDISGRATRFASRRFVIWLTPAIFICVIALIVSLTHVLPPDRINGDPSIAIALSSVITLGAQAFVLWLISRWARGEGLN